jgi:uncharacterized protein involved in exopolysaccharide biosynthesis
MKKVFYIVSVLLIAVSFQISYGQKSKRKTQKNAQQQAQTQTAAQPPFQEGSTKSSAAYIELVNRKVEVEADYKELLVDYTEENPKVKIKKAELTSLNLEMAKINMMDASMIPKLTMSFGKLLLRKIDLEKNVSELLLKFSEEHPSVIKAKEKVQVLEQEIQKILH